MKRSNQDRLTRSSRSATLAAVAALVALAHCAAPIADDGNDAGDGAAPDSRRIADAMPDHQQGDAQLDARARDAMADVRDASTRPDAVADARDAGTTPDAMTRSVLTVTNAGTGTGTVTSAPSGISCGSTCSASFAAGAAVTLTAMPAAGSIFAGWSGACTGSTATCTLTLSTARSVTATFQHPNVRLMPIPDRTVACAGVNDTAALQSALDARGVVYFTGRCSVTSLFLPRETYLYGAGAGSDCASAPSSLSGTRGYDVIHFGLAGNTDFNGEDYLGYFRVCGGRNGIVSDSSTTHVTLDNVAIEAMSGDGITIKGGIEVWNLLNVLLRNNDVGFHAYDDIGTRDQSRMDKVVLNMTVEGNRIGTILGAHYQDSVTLDTVVARGNSQDGIQMTGESRGVVLINPIGASNGGCDFTLPAGYCKEGIFVSGGSLGSACSIRVDATTCSNGYPVGSARGVTFNGTATAGTVTGTVHRIAAGTVPLLTALPVAARMGATIEPVHCGGVDDTAALQRAIDTRRPVYFTGTCQVRTLVLHSGTILFGGGISLTSCTGARSVLRGTSGYDILQIEDLGTTPTSSVQLYNFNTCDGRNGISARSRTTDLFAERVVISFSAQDAVSIHGSATGWSFRDVTLQGSPVGFHTYADVGSASESRFANASIQIRADFNTQAVVLASAAITSVTFPDFQVHRNLAGENEAMLVSGAADRLVIEAPYVEQNNPDASTAPDFTFTGAAPKTALFIAGNISIGNQLERYSIDASGASALTLVSSVAWRPLNDPRAIATWP